MTSIGERNQEISEHYMTYIVGGQNGLITQAEYKKLLANYEANKGKEDTTDFQPVVKLFNAWGPQTWLLSEIDHKGIFFGVCDMGSRTTRTRLCSPTTNISRSSEQTGEG